MTDNTQELDEIIREMRYRVLEDNGLTVNGLTTIEQETKQAITDWHNSECLALLEDLEKERVQVLGELKGTNIFNSKREDILAVPLSAIQKAKERYNGNVSIMTTDEIDGTTRDDRAALVGFCDDCEEWYKFVDDSNDIASRNHSCGKQPSNRLRYQITSQRTF